jgi:ribose-phosphate pyrophosphokinase
MDLHAGQIQGFFDIPVDNLYAMPVFAKYLLENYVKNPNDCVVVSPDAGGVTRARFIAKKLHLPLAVVDKRRPSPGVAKAMYVVGDVKDMTAIIVDDIIDTAGTLVESANALLKNGAKQVVAVSTHGVLSGPALERIVSSPIKEVVVTDTIFFAKQIREVSKINVLTTAPLFATSIERIHHRESISSLFESDDD